MRNFVCLGLLSFSLCLTGCGGGPEENPIEATPVSATEELRTMLTDLAKTGQSPGSGGQIISERIEEIRKTDPAKADKLQATADNLISASNPAKVKSLANEMLSNL